MTVTMNPTQGGWEGEFTILSYFHQGFDVCDVSGPANEGKVKHTIRRSSSSTWRQQVHQTQQAPKEMVAGLSLDCNAIMDVMQ